MIPVLPESADLVPDFEPSGEVKITREDEGESLFFGFPMEFTSGEWVVPSSALPRVGAVVWGGGSQAHGARSLAS
jgi:hypothetical protein